MCPMYVSEWRKLPVSIAELCLETTLRCGQSFRWKKFGNEWHCALQGRIVSLKQDSTHLHYRSTHGTHEPLSNPSSHLPPHEVAPPNSNDDSETLIHHYLHLGPDLDDLYKHWSSVDPNFEKRAVKFAGIRILNQDAWETLLGFICSSNNNIARISQMVNNLCLHYGPLVGYIDEHPFHDFPPPETLTGEHVESHLRKLGFGYRAGYIMKTARAIVDDLPNGWLQGLCNPEVDTNVPSMSSFGARGRDGYRNAHEQLLQLQGVGPKVADCVCLMGLRWGESVPVDTHVWQIAQRDYKFGKGKHRSLTKATYDAVGDHFRNLWGINAGWAHSVLFAADLKTFSGRTSTMIEVDDEKIEVKEGNKRVLESKVTSTRHYAHDEVVLPRTKRRKA